MPARPTEMVTLLALEAALFCVLLVLPELELLPELPELPELPDPLDEPLVALAAAPVATLVMVDVPLPTALLAELAAASVLLLASAVELCDCDTANRPWLMLLTVLHWLLDGAG